MGQKIRYGADIVGVLSFFLINNAIAIEEHRIPYIAEPSDEELRKIRGPQEYHKYIALQLLLLKNITREKIKYEHPIYGRKVDVYAKRGNKKILIECCSCSIKKIIEYLEETSVEIWIITDGYAPWDKELLKLGESQWFIFKRGPEWKGCYAGYQKYLNETLEKARKHINKLERV